MATTFADYYDEAVRSGAAAQAYSNALAGLVGAERTSRNARRLADAEIRRRWEALGQRSERHGQGART